MTWPTHRPTVMIALGGNALIRKGQTGLIEEQFENLKLPLGQIARLSREYRMVITHGNGPQVGALMLQQESCQGTIRLPLEILVAQTQGQIGYMIESTLDAQLTELGLDLDQSFITVLTYVVVDPTDPAFARPTKPIGPVYSAGQAAALPYPTVETAKGWRRVVVSPRPVSIVEHREIRRLIDNEFIVICCGGGGIPVVREGKAFAGVDAVIDKDLASARLAEQIGVDVFIIATDVPGLMADYGQPNERLIERLTVAQARRMLAEGALPAGSMGPKVEAGAEFIAGGEGKRAVICGLEGIEAAVTDRAGTEIVAG